MATLMNETEIQTFGQKLEDFGESLSAKEQLLLAEILTRAAVADGEVEGHAINLSQITKPDWPEVRSRMKTMLVRFVEEYGKTAPYAAY